MNNADLIKDAIKDKKGFKDDMYEANLSVNKRLLQHETRKMEIAEWLGWSKVASYYLAIILSVLSSLKIIFCTDIIDNIIKAFTETSLLSWRSQLIYALVIITYFICGVFKKNK